MHPVKGVFRKVHFLSTQRNDFKKVMESPYQKKGAMEASSVAPFFNNSDVVASYKIAERFYSCSAATVSMTLSTSWAGTSS